MKKLVQKSNPSPAWYSTFHRSRHLFGAFLMSSVAASADVTLTFDTDVQGITAGQHATSVAWDSVGQRLEINTTGGWRPECAYLDLNSTDPAIVPLKAELSQALINGGTLTYDIIVETTSVTGINPGWFESIYIGNSNAGWDQTFGGGTDQITAYGAFPLAAPINHTVNYTIVAAASVASNTISEFGAASTYYQINLGMNSQDGTTIKYYIDNIKIAANVVAAPVVIPTLTIAPTIPGLNMIASSGGAFDRQGVRTYDGTDVTWVGGTFPKTYEVTVASCPTTSYETYINFVPGTANPNSFAHYSEPVCAGLWIYSEANGGGTAYFRYKNGYPNSNGPANHQYWEAEAVPGDGGGGQIAVRSSTKMLGTWKITFTSDTDFTITAPDGTTSSASLNATYAAKFGNPDPVNTPNPMVVYFGNTPTSNANVGLTAVLSHIKITGTGYPIDEDLVANPMSADLVVAAQVPASVVQLDGVASKYWISWTLPATDFQLEQSTDLAGGSWVSLPSPVTYATKGGRSLLLLESEALSPTTDFFRMVKPGTP
jgi:hypothetical protein